MDNEIVTKIQFAVGRSVLSEADVQHTMTLTRKLIERIPAPQVNKYPLLKFYCDWTLHSKIDRSEAGGQILAKLHHIVADDLEKPDTPGLIKKLSDALSFRQTRDELNALVRQFGGPAELANPDKWRRIVSMVAEIVSNIPLTVGGNSARLRTIAQGIRAKPLRGTSSVVESLTIIPNSQIEKSSQVAHVLYWIELTTTGNVRIRAPLVWN